ncbi:MAG: hypothetical protein V2A61_05705, partial [Calditrichota bacterium]
SEYKFNVKNYWKNISVLRWSKKAGADKFAEIMLYITIITLVITIALNENFFGISILQVLGPTSLF